MTQVISWNTHKVENGFQFRVYTIAHATPSATLKTGVCRTREIATNRAKKWTIWFKAQAKKAA